MAAGIEAGQSQDCFAQLERGARFEGYRVRRVLSRVNGGALHHARAPDGTRVLLRVLSPRGRAPEVQARIQADLQRLARVDHRCVARLVGRGEDFFAVEHPGGLTLLELVRRGKAFDAPELVWIGHGLASGLLALHAEGLAHGNVSPSAIHVNEDGPALADVGWPTRLGLAGGAVPSRAGDVRALASTLTFAVVGAPSEPRDRVVLPGAPREVAAILRAALDPTSPPPTMERLRRVFERAADGLGLLDAGGAPASLGRRLREAVKLHAASSAAPAASSGSWAVSSEGGAPSASSPSSDGGDTSAEQPTLAVAPPDCPPEALPAAPSAPTSATPTTPPTSDAASPRTPAPPSLPASSPRRDPPLLPLHTESLALEASSEEAAALPGGPAPRPGAATPAITAPETTAAASTAAASTTAASTTPETAASDERFSTDQPPPIRTPSGRVVPQNPFASADLDPALRSASGVQDEPPLDLQLRHGLELIHRRVLGQGGMGVVHLVLDPRLGRRAALKLLRTPVTPSRVRRFRRETVVTARLDHPCIPPVHEAGTTPGGTHYLLMRFVEGESLAEILQRRGAQEASRKERDRDARELLHALVKVGEAVAYAHSRGIVHRDLKPANLMIGAFGEVLVMDWGLARDLNESSDEDAWIRTELGVAPRDAGPDPAGRGASPGAAGLGQAAAPAAGITQDGAILGTPGYLSPEQARGEDVDARTDVFSLGAVLCEILTGRPPVIGPTVLAVLGLTRGGEVEFPHQRFVTVDPELDAIATRALAPDAEARYPSAEAFAADLRAYLEGRNVSAYSYGLRERAARAVRRHPAITTALGVGLVLWLLTSSLLERARVEQARVLAEQEQEVHRRVTDRLVEAQLLLDDKRYEAARTAFTQALALDPASDRARQGEALAARLEQAELARAADEQDRRREAEERRRQAEQLAALLAAGTQHLAQGDLGAARRAYEQAVGFAPDDDSAQALALLGERLERAEEDAQEALQRARDAEQAARFIEDGRAHLAAGRRREAQAALIKAMAYGSPEASALLLQAEEALVEERGREVQRELERREVEQAARLVERADAALRQGALEEARTAFIQALAFDGKNEAAQRGLLEADRALQARAEAARADEVRSERVRRVRHKQAQSREALARARELDQAGAGDLDVREQYLAALDLLDEALFLLPDDRAARLEKAAVARELAQLLFEDGHQELGEFVLRLVGVDAQAAGAALDPTRDPDLVVVEADRVRIAHAFDGAVRFQPSRAFDPVRDYVRTFKGRYRVTVQVRSEATLGNPPRVHATGLWVRVEDRSTHTVHPTIKIDFERGPYLRPVTVDPTGRTVAAFERALSLDVERYVRQVEAELRRLLEAQ